MHPLNWIAPQFLSLEPLRTEFRGVHNCGSKYEL
jgi:hypothetical protein